MQTKVSMVIPCYNKEAYIAKTLECAYNQKWGNLEIIIINDGSTDGTLEIIKQWEPKLTSRGYEVIIINQPNEGVASATKNGLIRSTGDYICFPDADDSFSPYYVSNMAKVLDDFDDVNWVWCNIDAEKTLSNINRKDRILLLLLHKYVFWSIYNKLYRKSYIFKCGVVEKFVNSRLSQEPQFFIPLAAGGSFPYLLSERLYFYNKTVDFSIMNIARKSFDCIKTFWEGYRDLEIDVLEAHDLKNEINEFAVDIAFYRNICRECMALENNVWNILSFSLESLGDEFHDAFWKQTMNCDIAFSLIFEAEPKIPKKFTEALSNAKKVVFCCCLSSIGKMAIPKLTSLGIVPDLLWDLNAKDHYDKIKKPDYASLNKDDLLCIFSINEYIINDIRENVQNDVYVFSAQEVQDYIFWRHFHILKQNKGKKCFSLV
ncbi:MAG: glycosyltransferase family 2 protein [Clostridiales bacterium]|jgi:glycosyltransferase involved in cell wall biosynthesis|nr:glycosyltransferase family 2 protein [Clostridiales bacterium]